MAYLNKVMLIGNLGKDPEIRMTTTGRKKVSFSLATSRRYRDSNGETKEITDWHNIIGWGKVADIFESLNVRKGMSLFVEGTLSYRSWDDQATGQKRYMTEVSIDTFQLLTPRSANPSAAGTSYNRPSSAPSYDSNANNSSPSSDMDDDLPF
ncbi:MAG TPA: single-stranded DNA-binding protein [Fibrobacter sp.]|nr:single-stranded DNA-binding protein [Fibrobacter sp.]